MVVNDFYHLLSLWGLLQIIIRHSCDVPQSTNGFKRFGIICCPSAAGFGAFATFGDDCFSAGCGLGIEKSAAKMLAFSCVSNQLIAVMVQTSRSCLCMVAILKLTGIQSNPLTVWFIVCSRINKKNATQNPMMSDFTDFLNRFRFSSSFQIFLWSTSASSMPRAGIASRSDRFSAVCRNQDLSAV